ncbi:MAG TPA: sigma factor G inhibitor Gin [Clostridiaceae bacterium]
MRKQICIICRKPLSNGIIIRGKGICRSCEDRLVTSSQETDLYEYYKDRIKKNLVNDILRGEDLRCPNYHL